MESPTGYHEKLLELSHEIVEHGWGSFTFEVRSLKDNTVQIEIKCGKYHNFFIKKKLFKNEENIL